MNLLKYTFNLATALVVITLASAVMAAEKVVVVPLFDTSPNGVAAIPVYCSELGLNNTGATSALNCNRSDTRTSVMPVPAGHFLFITDIWSNRNSLVTAGRAFVIIGRDNGGSIGSPKFDFSIANVSESFHVNWSVPYLVFKAGERVRMSNGDISGLGETVDIHVSGYLVKTDGF